MIIVCPNCNKKFEIEEKLITSEGRLLQCGSCEHKWFFKKENTKEIDLENRQLHNYNDQIPKKQVIKDKIEIAQQKKENKTSSKKTSKINKNNINYFKILLVVIISFIALIIILDTFKDILAKIFPNIHIILDNLYQSLKDIKLFILDFLK